jgi:hypothetical protein
VCRALSYAHTRRRPDGRPLGIVHRDISPQNVLLSEQGEVRVTDFGIAKALGKRTRTETGVVKGNADFMSPEQASGAPLDATSDIFSVGAMLYLLATGERPFTGPTELDTLHKVQKGEYRPPEKVNRLVPAAVAAIVNKAMQSSLSHRYRTAKEMMLEVEAVLRRDFRAPGQSELAQWLAELAQRDGELPASRRAGLPYEATKVLGVEDIIAVEEAPAAASDPATDHPEEPSITPPPPVARSGEGGRPRSRGVGLLVGLALAAGVGAVVLVGRSHEAAAPTSPTAGTVQPALPASPAPAPTPTPPRAAPTAAPPADEHPAAAPTPAPPARRTPAVHKIAAKAPRAKAPSKKHRPR